MKTRTFLFAVVLSCLLLPFTGCAAPEPAVEPDVSDAGNETAERDNIPFSEGQGYAVAYLGYQQIEDLDFYAERYLDSDKVPIHYLSAGEYYLVIPRYTDMSLSLYKNDIETSDSTLIFEDPDCEHFILQCNASDIFADATVRLTGAGGEFAFSPFISLENGDVVVGQGGLLLTREAE